MFRNLFIISLLFFASSCGKKMMPQTDTVIKDSIIEKTVISYHSDTVNIPGDTIVYVKEIPCPDAKFDTVIKKGNTTLQAHLSKGQLQVICQADSLLHVIDSLQTITNSKEQYHIKVMTVTKPVEVIKYRVPAWCWYWIIATVLFAGVKILIWKYRK